MRSLLSHPRRLAAVVALMIVAAAIIAAVADSTAIGLLAIVGAVISMGLVNQQAHMVGSRRIEQQLSGLEDRFGELEQQVSEVAEWLGDETRALPPEHVEQLLRTVRASMSRIEAAQVQLVTDVEERARGR